MTSTEQLERETEQARARLADSLEELRARMTPGQIVDQLSDYVRNGGGAEFVSNLRDQTVRNPLALGLVGTGLAWLMLGGRGPSMEGLFQRSRDATSWAGETTRSTAQSASDTADMLRRRTSDATSGMVSSVRSSAADLGETARQTGQSLRERAGSLVDTVSEGASSARQRTMETGNSLIAFCREQPLLLAGLGLAMGAIAGALLPGTDTEDRLMGEASDAAKDEAGRVVSEQMDRARDVAADAVSSVKEGVDDARSAMQDSERDTHPTAASGPTEVHEVPLVPDENREGWPADNAHP